LRWAAHLAAGRLSNALGIECLRTDDACEPRCAARRIAWRREVKPAAGGLGAA
jgi:hypothetical protein